MVRSASKLFYLLSLLLVYKNILLQTELKMTNISTLIIKPVGHRL